MSLLDVVQDDNGNHEAALKEVSRSVGELALIMASILNEVSSDVEIDREQHRERIEHVCDTLAGIHILVGYIVETATISEIAAEMACQELFG